jgi:hypothetical protein
MCCLVFWKWRVGRETLENVDIMRQNTTIKNDLVQYVNY